MTVRAQTGGPGTIHFCYADPAGFSGQKAAAELVRHGLAARGWATRKLPQPVYARGGGPLAALRYLGGLLATWMRATRLLAARGGWLWVGLGQTRMAFLRDAVPLLVGRVALGRSRVVVSLNGSVFMGWADGSWDARVFRFLLNCAGLVTVVGARQQARLVALGIPLDRVKVVVNSCDLPMATPEMLGAKHRRAGDGARPVGCLYLSSLIDTKGFPEFLEALQILAALPGPPIEATLCGRLVASDFSRRFRGAAAAETWIEQRLTEANRSARVRVRWVRGAAGAEKAALFRDAEIFVLPTRYTVEAQPLALLEAMATGCAIITSRAGEIPTILDESCAVLLASPDTPALADALQTLVSEADTRARLAHAAHTRFSERYQPARHLDEWEELLGRPSANSGKPVRR